MDFKWIDRTLNGLRIFFTVGDFNELCCFKNCWKIFLLEMKTKNAVKSMPLHEIFYRHISKIFWPLKIFSKNSRIFIFHVPHLSCRFHVLSILFFAGNKHAKTRLKPTLESSTMLYVKSVRIRSFSGPYSISQCSIRMR